MYRFVCFQEEKDKKNRVRYNGRQFRSWIQDVDDKYEKIKVSHNRVMVESFCYKTVVL